MSVWSSTVVTAPSGPLLLQYWGLSWDGGNMEGDLTDPHTREAAALNLVNWPNLPVPCRPELGSLPDGYPHALSTGSSLQGEVTGQQASLRVQGSATDGVAEVSLTFTGSS